MADPQLPKTFVGVLVAELFLRGYRTLKEKRSVLSSLQTRLIRMGFSAAQVGPTDLIQRAWLSAVFVSGSPSRVSKTIESAVRLFHDPRWETVSIGKDLIELGDDLPIEPDCSGEDPYDG